MGKARKALQPLSVEALVKAKRLAVSVAELERQLLDAPQMPCSVRHSFAPGLYVREVTMPATQVVIGHVHKTAHLNIMAAGRLMLVQPDGSYVEHRAGSNFVGLPGRKVALILEDTVWLNVFATTETDIAKLEAELLDKSQVFKDFEKKHQPKRWVDRLSFNTLLTVHNLKAEAVRAISVNEQDTIPFPYGTYKCKVGPSTIEGLGMIATADIAAGEPIAPARIGGKRTPAGRYTNHGATPNARMMLFENGDMDLVAIAPIAGCRGGMDGEEITVDYAETMKLNLAGRAA